MKIIFNNPEQFEKLSINKWWHKINLIWQTKDWFNMWHEKNSIIIKDSPVLLNIDNKIVKIHWWYMFDSNNTPLLSDEDFSKIPDNEKYNILYEKDLDNIVLILDRYIK